MRTKLREIKCVDDKGCEALVVEWGFAAPSAAGPALAHRQHSLEDGSPVTPVGGIYEHFYTGRVFRPA